MEDKYGIINLTELESIMKNYFINGGSQSITFDALVALCAKLPSAKDVFDAGKDYQYATEYMEIGREVDFDKFMQKYKP